MTDLRALIGLDNVGCGAKPKQQYAKPLVNNSSSNSSSEENLSLCKDFSKCSGSASSSLHSNGNDYHYIPQAVQRDRVHFDVVDFEENRLTPQSKPNNANKFSSSVRTENNEVLLEPNIEDFHYESSRLDSFSNEWKYESFAPQKRLSKNGWFKIGRKDDVMCVQCKRIKKIWSEKDSIVGSHKQNCTFRKDGLKESFRPCSQSSSSSQCDSIESAVKGVVELGMYTQNEVENAVAALGRKGLSVTTDTIMEELIESPADPQSNNVCDSSSYELSHSHTGVRPKTHNSDTTQDKTKMLQDNEQFKSRVTCKVCLDQAVRVLFLPCRHLICCQSCADHLPTCPVCRATIVATIKAFV